MAPRLWQRLVLFLIQHHFQQKVTVCLVEKGKVSKYLLWTFTFCCKTHFLSFILFVSVQKRLLSSSEFPLTCKAWHVKCTLHFRPTKKKEKKRKMCRCVYPFHLAVLCTQHLWITWELDLFLHAVLHYGATANYQTRLGLHQLSAQAIFSLRDTESDAQIADYSVSDCLAQWWTYFTTVSLEDGVMMMPGYGFVQIEQHDPGLETFCTSLRGATSMPPHHPCHQIVASQKPQVGAIIHAVYIEI